MADTVAQTPVPRNWDEDIKALRFAAAPNFSCPADDYVQYSPAALMLALKACGYEGRTGWWQMLTADAFSIATMAALVNGIKYSVNRTRPNGYGASFPSGHTATAFMTATLLHKEYGWRSPWWSIGGYSVAAFTAVSRILNNKHWMSDLVGGALIGVGSVHLGYYLSDLIFKGRYINPAYEAPVFSYDASQKHYVAELFFGRRFTFGTADVSRGGMVGLSTDIPFTPGAGVNVRATANSLTYSSGTTSAMYSILAGLYYNYHFARRLELQARAAAGCGWHDGSAGCDVSAGLGLSFLLNDNFKIKAFADYETVCLVPQKPWMHSLVLGWSSAWFF